MTMNEGKIFEESEGFSETVQLESDGNSVVITVTHNNKFTCTGTVTKVKIGLEKFSRLISACRGKLFTTNDEVSVRSNRDIDNLIQSFKENNTDFIEQYKSSKSIRPVLIHKLLSEIDVSIDDKVTVGEIREIISNADDNASISKLIDFDLTFNFEENILEFIEQALVISMLVSVGIK